MCTYIYTHIYIYIMCIYTYKDFQIMCVSLLNHVCAIIYLGIHVPSPGQNFPLLKPDDPSAHGSVVRTVWMDRAIQGYLFTS